MSEDATAPVQVSGLTLVGDPNAGVCEGDVCLLPAHLEAHVVHHRLDEDRV